MNVKTKMRLVWDMGRAFSKLAQMYNLVVSVLFFNDFHNVI